MAQVPIARHSVVQAYLCKNMVERCMEPLMSLPEGPCWNQNCTTASTAITRNATGNALFANAMILRII